MTTSVATIPEKETPTLTPAKTGSESTPATLTPLKSRNLPYIIELNPESDSDSFWEKSRFQATLTPGIVATLVTTLFPGQRPPRPGGAPRDAVGGTGAGAGGTGGGGTGPRHAGADGDPRGRKDSQLLLPGPRSSSRVVKVRFQTSNFLQRRNY